MRLSDFGVLTFDCYGTLIDWESGIAAGLAPLAVAAGGKLGREELLALFAAYEPPQEAATPHLKYSDLLTIVYKRIAEHLDVPAPLDECARFGLSVGDWPAFPDSAGALAYLKQHYRLVILSNVDNRSFAASNKKLGLTFDAIYTAEEIGGYKPSPRNFDYMLSNLERRGIAKAKILHTAQSLYHDHVPANAQGLASAWIDRRGDKAGGGATKPVAVMPRLDFKFPSMAALVDAHRRELAVA